MSDFQLVNVGSGRLATDGECIYDAFVKINTNFTNLFTLVGIEQNIITVNVDNALVITQQIQIQNNVDVTMVTISIDLSNNMIVDVTNSVTMNITTAMNININSGDNIVNITNNSVDIDINTGDTTVNITNTEVDINTTNTIIDNSNNLTVITDNSTNSYTWVFQNDGTLKLPNGGDIQNFSGDTVVFTIQDVLNEIEVINIQMQDKAHWYMNQQQAH